MTKKTLWTALVISIALGTSAAAQPPDYAVFPGDEEARHQRGQDGRLERMVEYLELSESQTVEWKAITDQHTEAIRNRLERVGTLRQEFGELADQPEPNLEDLGRIALDLHREVKAARSSRGGLFTELEAVLTPEQAERFAALKAAREFSGQRDRRGHRGGSKQPDSD